MRKWNNFFARVIIVLFLLHALMGSLMLLGMSNISWKPLSWLLLAAVIAHGVLGTLATVQAVKSGKASGKWYLRQNTAYWTKTLLWTFNSDFAGFSYFSLYYHGERHILFERVYLWEDGGTIAADFFRFLHLAVSVKSMLIAKGVVKFKERTVDWMMVLSLLMLFFAAAVIYFIQWQV